jgi:hypothetical protein
MILSTSHGADLLPLAFLSWTVSERKYSTSLPVNMAMVGRWRLWILPVSSHPVMAWGDTSQAFAKSVGRTGSGLVSSIAFLTLLASSLPSSIAWFMGFGGLLRQCLTFDGK